MIWGKVSERKWAGLREEAGSGHWAKRGFQMPLALDASLWGVSRIYFAFLSLEKIII